MPPETSTGTPSKLGKYELLVELAGSGVATSWIARAEDDRSEKPQLFTILRLHRHVAKNVEVAEAFLKEARHAQKLKHPSVTSIVETGIGDGEVFVVSEYVEGDTLAALTLQAGAAGLPAAIHLRIAIDVLEALGAAHTLAPEPIFHGELSPWHVLVGADGVARVTAFGIARALSKVGTHGVKNQDRLGYASPERVKAMATVAADAKTDLFSIGVMLWEGIAKQRLFGSKIEAAVIQKVLTSPIQALGSVAGVTVAAEIADATMALLSRDPAKRTASASEVLEALRAAGADPAADAKTVGEIVEKTCGKALSTRRAEITAALARPKNSVPPPKAPNAPRARAGTLVGIPLGLGPLPNFDAKPSTPAAASPGPGVPPGPGVAAVAVEKSAPLPKAPIIPPPPPLEPIDAKPAAAKSPEPPKAAPPNGARIIRPRAATLMGFAPVMLPNELPPKPPLPVQVKPPPPPVEDEVSFEVDDDPDPVEAEAKVEKAPESAKPAPPKPPEPRKPFKPDFGKKLEAPKPPEPKAEVIALLADEAKVDSAKPAPAPKSEPPKREEATIKAGTPVSASGKGRGVQALAIDRIQAGSTLGRYEVLMPVARGGMAAVWAARIHGTRGFQKIVALKTMLPDVSDDPDFETMFLDEARIAARIRHPNVVEIMDLGEESDVLYIVMEWVDGETVGVLQKAAKPKGGIPVPILLRIASQCCAGLHAAHELRDENGHLVDLVHRDISPANVLISTTGFVKIVDFGIAKSKSRLHVTQVGGAIKGKTPYLSPEQLGGMPVDRRSDLFSLGAMLYVLTTGLHPFRGDTDLKTIENIALKPAVSPRQVVPAIPEELERILMKALEKEPGNRFATAGEMQRAIDALSSSLGATVTDEDVAAFVHDMVGDGQAKRAADLKAAIATVDAESSRQGSGDLTDSAAASSTEGKSASPFDVPAGPDAAVESAFDAAEASQSSPPRAPTASLNDDDDGPLVSPEIARRKQLLKLVVAGVVAGLAILVVALAAFSGGGKPKAPTTRVDAVQAPTQEATPTPPPTTASTDTAAPMPTTTAAAADTTPPPTMVASATPSADVAATPPTPDPAPTQNARPTGRAPRSAPTPPKPSKPGPKPKKFNPTGI